MRCHCAPRIALKRALVSRLVGFGFDERDPTHELLDVVNSKVAAMVAPLSSLVRAEHVNNFGTRELHLVSLDYGGETREVGAIDINIDQDLVA